jgi:hypothetical protein
MDLAKKPMDVGSKQGQRHFIAAMQRLGKPATETFNAV